MGFHLILAVFILELFSAGDKNSENWPQFSAAFFMSNLFLQLCILGYFVPKKICFCLFLYVLNNVLAWRLWHSLKPFFFFLFCFKLPNTSEQSLPVWCQTPKILLQPQIRGCHQSPVWMWLLRFRSHFAPALSCLEITGRAMWAYAFLNKPETLSPEMELWLCGCTDWVVGGHRTYVYCKLRQILSAKYKSRSETKKIQLKASRAAVSGQYGLKSLVIEGLPVN